MEKKRVMIGTPSYDGSLSVNYTYCLIQSMFAALQEGIELVPIFVTGDAIIQKARNYLFDLAYKSDVSDLIMIDSDIAWEPAQLLKLLSYSANIVGGTYRRKTDDKEDYVVKISENKKNPLERYSDGLIEVAALGTGFIRFSRKAIDKLYKKSTKYKEDDGTERAMVFDITINKKGFFTSEDVSMCNKWTALKGKVFLDPEITVNHQGQKNFIGNFLEWSKNLK